MPSSIALRSGSAALVAAALVAAYVVLGPAPAQAAPRLVHHVNLGDSYSAAVGTGGEAPSPPLGCVQGQGPDHVSRLDRRRPVELLLDAACSGATSADVRSVVALPVVTAALGEAELVTLTLGGNDVGWTQYLRACSRVGERSLPGACDLLLSQADARIGAAAASAGTTLAAIDVATDATVVVLGYPRLMEGTADTPFITAARAAQLNVLTDQLNAALRQAAVAEGATFADVSSRFEGHGIDAADPWIVFDLANPAAPGSLHPTSEAYLRGYYPALVRSVSFGALGRG